MTGTHRKRITRIGRVTCGDSDTQTQRWMGAENERGGRMAKSRGRGLVDTDQRGYKHIETTRGRVLKNDRATLRGGHTRAEQVESWRARRDTHFTLSGAGPPLTYSHLSPPPQKKKKSSTSGKTKIED